MLLQVITDALDGYNLVTLHLLLPLDLMTNGYFKKMEKAVRRDYLTNPITRELQIDPEKDMTTIKVDLKLSTLKPNAKVMTKIYHNFKNGERKRIMNSWKAAGVIGTIQKSRSGEISILSFKEKY